jgi:hypothetical protein
MWTRSSSGSLEVAWRQLVPGHALAVILDHDQGTAALAQMDVDSARAGVERILYKFLHHRGRPLHHLAGGDLVDEIGRQEAYCHGDKSSSFLGHNPSR